MEECLIVTPLADEFVDEVARLGGAGIPVRGCRDASELLAAYSGQRILFGNPAIIASVFEQLPGVEWIQSSWAGVRPLIDHGRRDYVLTGVKDVFGPQMSEYTLGYLLARELKVFERRDEQSEHRWFRDHSGTLAGRTIGIMGTGSIGSHIAGTAKAFGMAVRGLSRNGAPVDVFDEVFPVAQLEAFLAECEFLVSTLPQTPGTDSLLNTKTLGCLPSGATFVNVGRSNVVDDDALLAALGSGRLSGAVLDVFDEEPLPVDSPLWDAPNLLVTAHISAISHPLLIVPIFVDNYRRFAAGEPLRYVMDFDAGY